MYHPLQYSDAVGHKKAVTGNVIQVLLSYSKMNDSVFWASHDKGYPYTLFLTYNELASGSTYERQLLQAAEGDSINYIVPADSVFKYIFKLPLPFFLHPKDMMKVNVRINSIMDSAQYVVKRKAIKDYIKDMDMQEQVNLARYITEHNIPDSDKHENVFIIRTDAGAGARIEPGSMVSLVYRGRFLERALIRFGIRKQPTTIQIWGHRPDGSGPGKRHKNDAGRGKAKIIIPSATRFWREWVIHRHSSSLYHGGIRGNSIKSN